MLKDAVEFTKRWLEIGAADIEHADHDGSASAPQVYRYFSMILDEIPDTRVHIAHFHETKRVASASMLAALQAGITHFEATLGGMGASRPTSWTTARCRGRANTIRVTSA
jgi:hydroxymethylglutaryl-CoA lyase